MRPAAVVSLVQLFLYLAAPLASAQPMNMVAGVKDESQNPSQLPFMLPVQPTEITEAMEDFRRFVGRKQWEKAFKHLEKVFNSSSNGLVLTDNGILLPSRLIAREALLELPSAGHDAYKLFFDAEAKKMLEQATGADEQAKLSQIFSRYLITSIGDDAANRLGDLHFELGNFPQAVYAWQSILDDRPDSRLSKARLRVKIGVALARQSRWHEFREVLRVVQTQHSTEKLTIAGKEVSALDHLRSLASKDQQKATAPGSSVKAGGVTDLRLAPKIEPLWQFRYFVPPEQVNGRNQPQQGLRLQQRWGGSQFSDIVPPVVVDQERAYLNLLGYDVAINLKDGKVAWRSGRFFEMAQKAQQGVLSSLEQFAISRGSDRIWSVAIDLKNQNQNQGQRENGVKFELISREAETGKETLHSQKIPDHKDWNWRGRPVVTADRIYIAASKGNQRRELAVLALSPKDGKLLWTTQVGSYSNDSQQNYWGQNERETHPALLLFGDRLFVDTHAGTLLQLETVTGQIEWGLNYLSEAMQTEGRFFWSPYGMRTDRLLVGPPQMIDGVLYVKGMRSNRLYAIDPLRPKVLWSRPVPKTSNFIGADEQRFYLGGEEISAFDLATRKIIWSVQVNLGTSYCSQLLTNDRIFHFSSRGIYEIDKQNGKVVQLLRGEDMESLGGELIVTEDALLTISNLAITAYPLKGLGKAADATRAEAPVKASAGIAKN